VESIFDKQFQLIMLAALVILVVTNFAALVQQQRTVETILHTLNQSRSNFDLLQTMLYSHQQEMKYLQSINRTLSEQMTHSASTINNSFIKSDIGEAINHPNSTG
jgi:hypothetical protein